MDISIIYQYKWIIFSSVIKSNVFITHKSELKSDFFDYIMLVTLIL